MIYTSVLWLVLASDHNTEILNRSTLHSYLNGIRIGHGDCA